MTVDPTASRPLHARLVARTDGAGALIAIEPEDGAEDEGRFALSMDLAAAALTQLGEARALGRFRSALVMFEGATVAIGRDEHDRSVVVVGDVRATPGLVLSHLNRVSAAPEKP